MLGFKYYALSSSLSRLIDSYDIRESEGRLKKVSCPRFDGQKCTLFKARGNSVSIWRYGERIDPHPLLCYVCPFSNQTQERELSLSEIFIYYEREARGIENEISWLDSKFTDVPVPLQESIRRRRTALVELLEDIREKEAVVKGLMRVSGAS